MSRLSRNVDITLHTATNLATTLDLRDVAYGVVQFGTMSVSATSLKMLASTEPNGTYATLYKADGNAVALTLAPSTTEGRAYALPDQVLGLQYLKIVSNDTNSTGVSGVVTLKS